MDEPHSPAELAKQIMGADPVSAPIEKKLRFQWNVPEGVTPHVPLWLTAVFVLLVLLAILDALLR